jgi:hypothetical protein
MPKDLEIDQIIFEPWSAAARYRTPRLPVQTEAELDDSRIAHGEGDVSKRRDVAHVGFEIGKIVAVEDIQEFSAHLQINALGEPKSLHASQINGRIAGGIDQPFPSRIPDIGEYAKRISGIVAEHAGYFPSAQNGGANWENST